MAQETSKSKINLKWGVAFIAVCFGLLFLFSRIWPGTAEFKHSAEIKMAWLVLKTYSGNPGDDRVKKALMVLNHAGESLEGVELSGAVLRWADLRGANMHAANLSGALMPYAKLSEAKPERGRSG